MVSLLAFDAPLLLEPLGVASPSYRMGAEGMTILPRAIDLHGDAALVLPTIARVGTVLTRIVAVGRLRDALDRAEHRLELHRWHFRQLRPDREARGGTAGDPTGARVGSPSPVR